ncbi:uncharacterized protein LOC124168676 [Ischnura elegans]|uniref:uncharacterized protein LOC124168676 n=1 Tax=Ischnura elegans TaxID=197161 RepID=UPI001ED8AA58|nr:uncharacterized protein LOC124168676 [Ischnura elegans]
MKASTACGPRKEATWLAKVRTACVGWQERSEHVVKYTLPLIYRLTGVGACLTQKIAGSHGAELSDDSFPEPNSTLRISSSLSWSRFHQSVDHRSTPKTWSHRSDLFRRALLLSVVILLAVGGAEGAGSPGCREWEFACRNGRCVPGTKYCDSMDNCGDLSDEPRHCSPCNRTYYGAVGVTLDLEIHRPREDSVPFLCPLTIAAAGDDHIVQVSFDSFTVGRFAGSGPDGGCPEGGLQIREKGRPRIGGWFCGTAWGLGGGGGGGGSVGGGSVGGAAGVPTGRAGAVDGSGVGGGGGAGAGPGRPPIFFSESDAVTLVLSLMPVAGQMQGHPPAILSSSLGPSPPAAAGSALISRRSSGRLRTSYDFDFRISFKILSKKAAVVRYGGVVPSFSGGPGNYHTIQSVNGDRDSSLEGGGSDDDFYLPQILHKGVNKWKSKTAYLFSLSIELLLSFFVIGLPVLLPPLLYPPLPPSLPQPPTTPPPPVYLHLGDLIPGTFCSRLFGSCDRRACALQSPNYPGLYPRNLTCYFAVRQHRAPKGQVALIAVAQRRGHLAPIPTAYAASNPGFQSRGAGGILEQQGHAMAWPECDDLHDYVTVYDGYTTRDPVLLRFCGGASSLPSPLLPVPSTPTAVSSGPELLVEFTSAPFGTLQPSPPLGLASAIRGFQLQVKVQFVDQDSYLYARNKRCEFWIRPPRRRGPDSFGASPGVGDIPTPPPDGSAGGSGGGGREFVFADLRGTLRNPVHSLAANTTCIYHLIGDEAHDEGRGREDGGDSRGDGGWMGGVGAAGAGVVGGGQWGGRRTKPEYRVWLSVLKFHVAPDPLPRANTGGGTTSRSGDASSELDCTSSLAVWDGPLGGEPPPGGPPRWRGSPGTPWDPSCPHGFCGGHRPSPAGPFANASAQSSSLLAKYCPTASASSPPPPLAPSSTAPARPPSCEHALLANGTRLVRPCSTRARPGPFQPQPKQQPPPPPIVEGIWRGPGLRPEAIIGTIGDPPRTTPKEGFLSSGRDMHVQMVAAESTALRPVAFAASYEFVDISQDGEAFGDGQCSRRFSSRPPASLVTVPSSPQRFTAPRNVFLYGRGGSTNLSCTYRFEVQEGERVRITVVRLLTGTRPLLGAGGGRGRGGRPPPPVQPSVPGEGGCITAYEPIGPHHRCIASNRPSRPPHVRLLLADLPWPDDGLPVTRHCLCSDIPERSLPGGTSTAAPPTTTTAATTSSPTSPGTPSSSSPRPTTSTKAPPTTRPPPPSPFEPFSYTSAPSRAVEVRFSAIGMGAAHDPDSVFFEADVEFVRVEEGGFFPTRQDAGLGKGKVVPTGRARRRKCEAMSRRKFTGPSGELTVRIPKPSQGEDLEQTLHCASQPYVIVPTPGRFLYVRTRGFHLMPPEGIVALPGRANMTSSARAPPCPTRNRLMVYSGGTKSGTKLKAIICPLPPTSWSSVDPRQRVEVFSEGWEESSRGPPPQPSNILPLPLPPTLEAIFGADDEDHVDKMAGAVVVEPMAAEDASYSLTWLEVIPRRSHRPLIPPPGYPFPFLQETVDANFLPSGECIHRCPELGACINASLWCDGREHCPSGFDESLCENHMGSSYHPLLRPPLLYASLATLILLLLLLLALGLHLRSRPRDSVEGLPSRHAPCPSCLPNGMASKSSVDHKSGVS